MKNLENKNQETIIRMRAYHPTYMICYFACQDIASPTHNKDGFDYVYNILKQNPETIIELTDKFDDICKGCKKLQANQQGSIWGDKHSCTSSENEEIVAAVKKSSQRLLKILGLSYGSRKAWKELVELLAKRLPELGDSMLGKQSYYKQGLKIIN